MSHDLNLDAAMRLSLRPGFRQLRETVDLLWERLEMDHLRFMANFMIVQACRQARVVQREGTCC